MRAATANASVATAERSAAHLANHSMTRAPLLSGREEVLLNLNLSDLVLPKVNDLNVDGLKPSWFSRLLGKK